VKERLVLDCDGVLVNFNNYINRVINEELGTSYRYWDYKTWNIKDCLGKEAAKIMYREMDKGDVWINSPMYPKVNYYVKKLANRYDIFIVSSLPEKFVDLRIEWLNKNKIPFNRFYRADSVYNKTGIMKEIGAVVAIEDNSEVCSQILKAGIDCYMIQRPWNQDIPYVVRSGWKHIFESVMYRHPRRF
jgi:5'(3')-deoxyribonucleotidase